MAKTGRLPPWRRILSLNVNNQQQRNLGVFLTYGRVECQFKINITRVLSLLFKWNPIYVHPVD